MFGAINKAVFVHIYHSFVIYKVYESWRGSNCDRSVRCWVFCTVGLAFSVRRQLRRFVHREDRYIQRAALGHDGLGGRFANGTHVCLMVWLLVWRVIFDDLMFDGSKVCGRHPIDDLIVFRLPRWRAEG